MAQTPQFLNDAIPSTPTTLLPASPRFHDGLLAAALGLAFSLLYMLLRQGEMTYDNVMFSWMAYHGWINRSPLHPLFIPYLTLIIRAGSRCGLAIQTSGTLQAAMATSAALAVFFLVLRRWAVGRAIAAVYTVLLGLSAAALDNGTQAELYGIAFLAVMVSLDAFSRELRQPSRGGALYLMLANAAVFTLHLGYGPWVLSLYLALMVQEWRVGRVHTLWRLAQGAAVAAAPFLLMRLLVYPPADWVTHEAFFNMYWRHVRGWTVLGRLLTAPMADFAAHAGLVIYPGVFGLALLGRRQPALAVHALLCSALFLIPYSFWVVDRGAFYMPLLPVWGLFAALGLQFIARTGAPRLYLLMGAGLVICAPILFAFQSPVAPFAYPWTRIPALTAVATVVFYELAAGLARAGWKLRTTPPARAAAHGEFVFLFALAAITITLVAYLPIALYRHRDDGFGAMRNAVTALAKQAQPEQVRLVMTSVMPERVEFDTGQIAGRPQEDIVAAWLLASTRPEKHLAVWTDTRYPAYFQATPGMDWSRWTMTLTPHRFGEVTLYRAKLAPHLTALKGIPQGASGSARARASSCKRRQGL